MTSESDTSVLGPAPIDWKVMPLGTVVERAGVPVNVKPDEMYCEIGIRSHGKGIFHKEAVSGASLGNKRVFSIVPNCLVFNIVFAWEGAVAVTRATESGMIGSHRFPMFASTAAQLVDVEFLLRLFHTKEGVRLLGDASPGGAGRNRTLNQKLLAGLSVPIPPLGEQTKIVAILQAVDEAIQTTHAVIDQLGVVKKALMAELLTRGIPGRHTKFKQTEIGEVPEGWEVVRVSELCSVITKGATPAAQTRDKGEVPFLKVYNIDPGGYLDFSYQPSFIPQTVHKGALSRSRIFPEDVLMNIVGPPLGKVAVVPFDFPESNINQAIAVFRPTRVEAQFLAVCLTAPKLFAWALTRAKRTSTQLNLTLELCRDYPMPLPPPAERTDILNLINSVSERMHTEASYLDAICNSKSALMSALLSGDLRVTPDEHPA